MPASLYHYSLIFTSQTAFCKHTVPALTVNLTAGAPDFTSWKTQTWHGPSLVCQPPRGQNLATVLLHQQLKLVRRSRAGRGAAVHPCELCWCCAKTRTCRQRKKKKSSPYIPSRMKDVTAEIKKKLMETNRSYWVVAINWGRFLRGNLLVNSNVAMNLFCTSWWPRSPSSLAAGSPIHQPWPSWSSGAPALPSRFGA